MTQITDGIQQNFPFDPDNRNAHAGILHMQNVMRKTVQQFLNDRSILQITGLP